jgi:glycosyltransferase involved in cell wall biosynthesis
MEAAAARKSIEFKEMPGVEYNPFWDAPKRVNLAAAAGRVVFFPVGGREEFLLDDSYNGMRCVAVLGQRNEAIDAVEEYCRYLGAALEKHAFSFEIVRVEWATKGWNRALRELRQRVGNERNIWVLLQYTALAWSRRGFSLRVPGVIKALKRNGVRCAVVFHDAEAYYGNRVIDRIRRAIQLRTMREAVRLADFSILTIPAEKIPWIDRNSRNVVFIPVGANLPSPEKAWTQEKDRAKNLPTVAVFSPSGNRAGAEEVNSIAETVRYAAERMGPLRLIVMGRNSEISGRQLSERLMGTSVQVTIHGLLPAEEIVQKLGASDVLLFTKGPISTRRGSAIAGIACGLPVIASEGWETGAPITEAGVVLVPENAKNEFGPALLRVLTNAAYRAKLSERSRQAQELYFSWSAIATQYAIELRTRGGS